MKIFKALALTVVLSLLATLLVSDILRCADTEAASLALPEPNQILKSSKEYSDPMLMGLSLDPENPLKIDFIIDCADKQAVTKEESAKLVSYFLSALSVSSKDYWVNLSPYEENRIIADSISQTELGKELLAQDYVLKQLSSSLTNPDTELGQKYWSNPVGAQYLAPDSKFNKVWIVPGEIEIQEDGDAAYITKSNLKLMSEQDYLAGNLNNSTNDDSLSVLLPELSKEVNHGKHFASLRQVYRSMIMAVWFKTKFRESFYRHYIEKNKLSNLELEDKTLKDRIYKLYCEAFEKGVYDIVKNEEGVKKSYFCGGAALAEISSSLKVKPATNFVSSAMGPIQRAEVLLSMGYPGTNGQASKVAKATEIDEKKEALIKKVEGRANAAYQDPRRSKDASGKLGRKVDISSSSLELEQHRIQSETFISRGILEYFNFFSDYGDSLSLESSLVSKINQEGQINFMDAGCGSGAALNDLKFAFGYQVNTFGVDVVEWTPENVSDILRNRHSAYHNYDIASIKDFVFKQGDIATVSFEEKMDIINSVGVLMYHQDPLKAIANLYNQLAIDGELFAQIAAPVAYESDIVSLYKSIEAKLKSIGVDARIESHSIASKSDEVTYPEAIVNLAIKLVRRTNENLSIELNSVVTDYLMIESKEKSIPVKIVEYDVDSIANGVALVSSSSLGDPNAGDIELTSMEEAHNQQPKFDLSQIPINMNKAGSKILGALQNYNVYQKFDRIVLNEAIIDLNNWSTKLLGRTSVTFDATTKGHIDELRKSIYEFNGLISEFQHSRFQERDFQGDESLVKSYVDKLRESYFSLKNNAYLYANINGSNIISSALTEANVDQIKNEALYAIAQGDYESYKVAFMELFELKHQAARNNPDLMNPEGIAMYAQEAYLEVEHANKSYLQDITYEMMTGNVKTAASALAVNGGIDLEALDITTSSSSIPVNIEGVNFDNFDGFSFEVLSITDFNK